MPNINKYIGMDLTGERHGRLVALRKSDTGRTKWVCQCDCGNIVEYVAHKFFQYQSCGCLEKENKENLGEHNRTHGMTKSILYHKYCGMKERCYNPNYSYYRRYGGRGIKMCDEWLGKYGFENFKKWAYENGYDDNKHTYQQTLDRIDLDGNYEPSNCRWVDMKTQSNNRRTSVFLICKGEKMTIAQFCDKYNISKPWFVNRRLKKGKNGDEILEEWQIKQEK